MHTRQEPKALPQQQTPKPWRVYDESTGQYMALTNSWRPPTSAPGLTIVASGTKACPYCAEEIHSDAKKCKYCHELVDVALRTAIEAKEMAFAILRGDGRDRDGKGAVNVNVNTNVNPVPAPVYIPPAPVYVPPVVATVVKYKSRSTADAVVMVVVLWFFLILFLGAMANH